MVGARGREGRMGRLHRWRRHAVRSRHKRLSLGVESVVPIVASGNGVLALGIVRIGVGRQLAEWVGDAVL